MHDENSSERTYLGGLANLIEQGPDNAVGPLGIHALIVIPAQAPPPVHPQHDRGVEVVSLGLGICSRAEDPEGRKLS